MALPFRFSSLSWPWWTVPAQRLGFEEPYRWLELGDYNPGGQSHRECNFTRIHLARSSNENILRTFRFCTVLSVNRWIVGPTVYVTRTYRDIFLFRIYIFFYHPDEDVGENAIWNYLEFPFNRLPGKVISLTSFLLVGWFLPVELFFVFYSRLFFIFDTYVSHLLFSEMMKLRWKIPFGYSIRMFDSTLELIFSPLFLALLGNNTLPWNSHSSTRLNDSKSTQYDYFAEKIFPISWLVECNQDSLLSLL